MEYNIICYLTIDGERMTSPELGEFMKDKLARICYEDTEDNVPLPMLFKFIDGTTRHQYYGLYDYEQDCIIELPECLIPFAKELVGRKYGN